MCSNLVHLCLFPRGLLRVETTIDIGDCMANWTFVMDLVQGACFSWSSLDSGPVGKHGNENKMDRERSSLMRTGRD